MPDESEAGAAGVIVYVDHSDIQDGRVDELKEGILRIVERFAGFDRVPGP